MSSETPPMGASASRRGLGSWLGRILRLVLVGYLLLLLLMLFFENRMLFVPSVYPEGVWQPPGLPIEDANFTAADGVKLHGWYVPHEQPRTVILFAHGNGGNITHRASMLWSFHHDLHASVMIFDYRGYGRSEGSPDEAGILADARAARKWLAQRAGVSEGDVVLFGESLGGGVMVDLAAKDGARGLILESTFSSLPEVAARHFPWLPVKLLMRTRLDSKSKIGDYHGPLLQAHGDLDSIVPLESGQALFDAANQPKEFVLMRGHDHNDPWPNTLTRAIDGFLDRLPADGVSGP